LRTLKLLCLSEKFYTQLETETEFWTISS